MTTLTAKLDHLWLEDISLEALAEEVQTPFYVYSTEQINQNYANLSAALNSLPVQICYAVKANSNQAVLKTLANLGAGADVVSGGELKRALLAGIPANKIVFSGVGKRKEEIDLALLSNIKQFNVESLPELFLINERCQALSLTAPVALRINPDVDVDTHEKITTGKAENKFGINFDQAIEVYQAAADLPGINIQGIDVHIGSQITDVTPYQHAFKRVAQLIESLAKIGINISVVDLGGGLGVCYDPNTDTAPDLTKYANFIKEEFAKFDVEFIVEPGRSLVASAGHLVSKVLFVKEGTSRNFVILDAAMNDFARPSMYDAYHEIIKANNFNDHNCRYDIVGPVCETGDTFAKGRVLPTINSGDLMIIKDTGAYGAVMASSYNTRALAPEVMVSGNQWQVIRASLPVDLMIDQDIIPAWLD